tara:strand:- start:9250 stop:10329 length:1080 start_codon:yes stop_codon:yes gene_type:complete
MINLQVPINNTTGYGITSTNIWKLLREKNNVSLFPIGGGVSLDEDQKHLTESLQQDLNNAVNTDTKHNNLLKIWHQHDLMTRVGVGKYSALTFFELDKFQQQEVTSLHHPDNVLVASNWAKGVVEQHGIPSDRVKVTPLGVDLNTFNSANFSQEDRPHDKYIFMNVGKWEIRKGHDLLINIFNEAFTEKDNVELWMVNHNPFLKDEQIYQWHKLYKESKLGDKIQIFPRLDTHTQLASLMDKCNCGIYLSRGEGWNNEAVETMALNKPLIITNYSAHTEYVNPSNSYLVDITETEPANDGIWFHGQGNWAKLGFPQIEQTIEHMRYVYKNNIRDNPKGLETAQKYTWQNTTDEIWKYLT